jgi:hypothetical protein
MLAMFGGNEELANEIISYRQGQPYGIETFAQLAEISSLKNKVLKKYLDMMCIRSNIYTIRTIATANLTDTVVQTEAVIDRFISPVQIVYFCQGAKY